MAVDVGDAVLKIKGDNRPLDQALQRSQNNVQSTMQKMQKSLRVTGIAFTALGAAGLKMVDSAREMNAQLGVTAMNLGVTTKEMRDLALETTNVTFPLKEVIASFDLLARAGIENTEVLKATATAFDTLGDAIGMGASQVAENMIPAMKTFGLSAEEIAAQVDSMTYLVRKTTLSLDDYNTMVGYTTPELVAMGLTMDDLTAILIHMERQGFAPGRVMTREFQKAVTLATKEQIPLTEAIGMTTEELAGYMEELEGATGMTQEYADEANKQYGIMDKVKQKFDELVLSAGSFLTPLEPLLAAMTAMGPVMMFLSTSVGIATVKWIANTAALIASKIAMVASTIAMKAITVAQWLWNAAMTANPIGIVVMAVAGLIAAGVALWKNWDKVLSFFEGFGEKIAGAFVKLKDIMLEPFRFAVRGIENMINWLIRAINKISFKMPDWLPDWMGGGKTIGFNIKEVSLPKFAKGGLIDEPTLLYGLRSMKPYAIAGEAGTEVVSRPGEGGITNTFNISQMIVREEADITKVARELYRLQKRNLRLSGV